MHARALGISPFQKPSSKWLLHVAVVLTLAWQFAFAAPPLPRREPPPSRSESPELRGIKAEFRKNLLAAVLPEMKAHREELLVLEKKLAQGQDFPGAIKIRNERVKTEKQITSLEQEAAIRASRIAVETASAAPQRIELKPAKAKLTKTRVDQADGALTGWSQTGACATWQLGAIAPGGYEVLVRCTGAAGDIIVKEGLYSLTQTCKMCTDKSLEQNLGTLRIHFGANAITLTPAHPEKCAGWRVYSIILVPSTI